jgi:STAS-like domain of unknown function (DUF4325)
MGLIQVLDVVEQCSSYESGVALHHVLSENIRAGESVELSFKGVSTVSTSFVNAALIELLEEFEFERIKSILRFVDTNRIINDTIKRRFAFEVQRMKQAVA